MRSSARPLLKPTPLRSSSACFRQAPPAAKRPRPTKAANRGDRAYDFYISLSEGSSEKSLAPQQVEERDSRRDVSPVERAIVALAREHGLSARETEVFAYLARGRNSKAIAQKLFISDATVRSHAYNIYGKLDVHSRQELMDCVEDCSREIEKAIGL